MSFYFNEPIKRNIAGEEPLTDADLDKVANALLIPGENLDIHGGIVKFKYFDSLGATQSLNLDITTFKSRVFVGVSNPVNYASQDEDVAINQAEATLDDFFALNPVLVPHLKLRGAKITFQTPNPSGKNVFKLMLSVPLNMVTGLEMFKNMSLRDTESWIKLDDERVINEVTYKTFVNRMPQSKNKSYIYQIKNFNV